MEYGNSRIKLLKSIYNIWIYGIINIGNGETTKWFAWLYVKTHRPAKTDVFFYGNKCQHKLPKKQE